MVASCRERPAQRELQEAYFCAYVSLDQVAGQWTAGTTPEADEVDQCARKISSQGAIAPTA